MKIEVACRADDTTKAKGDLLEGLATDLLSAQSFKVIEEIRVIGAELDLLCKHEVSGKEIYVECKAQAGNIGAPILRQLNGTVDAYDYAEGWLVSTAEFGKEAKGFAEMWKNKPADKASRLSFYTPDLIIKSLKKASVICDPPIELASAFVGSSEAIGEWTLVISPFGRFWAAYTLLGGAPHGVIFFGTKTGQRISDSETLNNIATLESVLCDYDVTVGVEVKTETKNVTDITPPNVVEVQTGESWDDYRPARPQDFIGRDDTQKHILNFLENARTTDDATRIFAITGNSGLGKSSLVAKVRDRTKNKHYKKKLFTFAIDMRGARNPAYVSASLIKCLEQAQKAGFGKQIDIQLTNPSTPLSSPSISEYLESLKKEGKFVCLIFDQFEELYSKPELYSVFTAAKDLMIDVASFKGAFGLGFAWKTDSTTQQDHPAYHIWHELSDHRREFKLNSFNKGEISKAITAFEKQADFKLTAEIRHQISHSSQGFPWLLKKLCIHLYENQDQQNGTNSTLLELDVKNLFENDLQTLNQREDASLKLIAAKAPADWSEIIEISGVATVNSLVAKRLIIRSGDRLNVYWDIFRDYLLSGNVPVVPFNYIPSSDINAMLKVGEVLEKNRLQTSETIASRTSLNERTVWNIGADLVLFGVAERQGTSFKLHRDMADGTVRGILSRIRNKIDKHSLKIDLYRNHAGQTIAKPEILSGLKDCLPNEKFSDKTWGIYTNRFVNIFVQLGFLARSGPRFTVQDSGSVVSKVSRRSRSSEVFSAMASPASVCDAFYVLQNNSDVENANTLGYRNSVSVLKRFNLIEVENDVGKLNVQALAKFGGVPEAVWTSAKNEVAITKCIEALKRNVSLSGPELGAFVSDEFNLNWTDASKARTGNALKQWANWIIEGSKEAEIPEPPGRKKRSDATQV
ncbi:restriction endonuclease [uncultured Pelagimonas sp.]|uniref:restriction endonuclease n=1 Tax=uncultured Pelagimonas sp. TaxID=1618102 RepID=UPI00262C6B89|nr:restriction endonuclease [uncultured Pelagimonas sp.]